MRDVARILLMGVYLTQSNYTRADALISERFKARTPGDENATRVYFALAGQLINGVRTRLERYRAFGLNPLSAELPSETRTDVEQLRTLLERVVDHARTIRDESAATTADGNGSAATRAASASAGGHDATALIEDAAAVRLTLAREGRERTRWQREIAEARQRLVSAETPRVAKASQPVPSRASAPAETAGAQAGNNASGNQERREVARSQPAPPSAATSASASANAPAGGNAPTSNTPSAPPPGSANTQTATARAAGEPLSVGSLHERATQKVPPSYPATARTLRIAGVVTVFLVVNERGEVESVQRMSGPSLLQPAAADAARRWRFRPTIVGDQPVRVTGFLNFSFTL